MLPTALVETIAKADCGATGIIKKGESSVLVQTTVEAGKSLCAGRLFSLRTNLTPVLDSANVDKHRHCVEDDAPVCR